MSKRGKKKPLVDPFSEREKQKYKNPIPSREVVLKHLDSVGRPLSRKQLFKALQLNDDEKIEAMGFRLKAMLRDGQLMEDRRGRLCLMERIPLTKGRVQGHQDGYGFVLPEDGSPDFVLSARQMRGVMHGDRVHVFETGRDRRGRREGKVHEVIEHANASVVGRFYDDGGVFFVEPENKRLPISIAIAPEDIKGAKAGQVVLVKMLIYPTKHHAALGEVIEILGDHLSPGMEIDVAILAHDIPNVWPQEVLDEVARLPLSVSEEECAGRSDLRQLDFVTIDGEDAKDFDDAVYCVAKPRGGWSLYVAIADVAHYVRPGSALDEEAYNRATSVYFPGRVVPMLPEQLSNGLCSLNPQVDRLAFVCEMSISAEGKLSRHKFYRGVIHSKARLTYTDVAAVLGGDDKPAHMPDLSSLHQLYKALLRVRKARGAMDFDTTETQILFDENKKIDSIVPLIRNDAHRLIEECMLSANVAAAKFIKKHAIPALYRVHESPKEEKLSALREFLSPLGLSLAGGKKAQTKDYQTTLNSAAGRPDQHLIQTVMLRSMNQAQYVEKNNGHFGLAYKAYTHFTSPIRRYPDLLTHRAIAYCLAHQGEHIEHYMYTMKEMSEKGKHCSKSERRADEASRDVVSWLKCEYLQDKVGQCYPGTISSVTGFGLFVELDQFYVEGLVHMTSLPRDYYHYDKERHTLIGEKTSQRYRLGDKLLVRIVRVDLNERKIDFDLDVDEDAD